MISDRLMSLDDLKAEEVRRSFTDCLMNLDCFEAVFGVSPCCTFIYECNFFKGGRVECEDLSKELCLKFVTDLPMFDGV